MIYKNIALPIALMVHMWRAFTSAPLPDSEDTLAEERHQTPRDFLESWQSRKPPTTSVDTLLCDKKPKSSHLIIGSITQDWLFVKIFFFLTPREKGVAIALFGVFCCLDLYKH